MKQIQNVSHELLNNARVIAIVGLSDKPDRASYRVAQYMQNQGYTIIPVNPTISRVLGETAYPDLKSIPFPIDIVNVFRRSESVPPIVDEAIEFNAKGIWMQLGVTHEHAAQKAIDNGLSVVMDKCIKIEHELLKN